MMITEKHFRDWENSTFGYGYGTGEEHTLNVLMKFFANLFERHRYDFRIMQDELGPEQFWLLLNTLCHMDIIEYSTSPRFGWLTSKGELIRDFLYDKSLECLIDIVCGNKQGEDFFCGPDYCNCDEPCNNPLFH